MSNKRDPRRMLQELLRLTATHAALDFVPLPTLGAAQLVKQRVAEMISQVSAYPTVENAKMLLNLRQCAALIDKNPTISGSTAESRYNEAMAGFRNDELHNRRVTKRLKHFFKHPSRMRPLVWQVLSEAQLDLFRLLGPGPTLADWVEFETAKVFSGGVTQGLVHKYKGKYKDADAYAKVGFENIITSSRQCLEMFGSFLFKGAWGDFLRDLLSIGELRVEESDYSKLGVQPKDAFQDRVIGTEPLMNVVAQHGIAAMLEPYLWSWGITLKDQSWNQKLAKIAAVIGFSPIGYATIDKKSASNSVLDVLVQWLFPKGWYRIMDAARTHYIKDDAGVHESTMFSTMGNAFTFPVECLVFASLARACMKITGTTGEGYRVYGDDVILPLSAALLYTEVSQFVGFRINRDKSFYTGHFRESCGADYLGEHPVRPTRLKGSLGHQTEVYKLFNAVQQDNPGSPMLPALYSFVTRPCVGPAMGPAGGEDGHFVAPVWYLRSHCTVHWKVDTQCYEYTYRSMTPTSRRRRRSVPRCRLLAALAGSHGESHDIQRTVRYVELVRVTTTPWLPARVAPLWYTMD